MSHIITKQETREILEFLRGIPDEKWGQGNETFNDPMNDYIGKHCYLGHVSLNPLSQWVIDQNKHLVVGQRFTGATNVFYRGTNKDCELISERINQLAHQKVGWSCVEANDNGGDYTKFCEDNKSTPRERVCQTLELLIPHLPDGDI